MKKPKLKKKRVRQQIKSFMVMIMVLAMVVSVMPNNLSVKAKASTDTSETEDTSSSDSDSTTSKSDIDSSTFEDLGLDTSLSDEVDVATSAATTATSKAISAYKPYANSASLYEKNEVYVNANGRSTSRYFVRDGLSNVGGSLNTNIKGESRDDEYKNVDDTIKNGSISTKDGSGNFSGAYQYYKLGSGTSKKIDDSHGNILNSRLSYNGVKSSNSQNTSVSAETSTFRGLYATSMEFNGGDGKKNYIAELQVGGQDNNYNIYLAIFYLDSNGKRTQQGRITLSTGNGWLCQDDISTFTYAALFDINTGDFDGDGVDEIAVFDNQIKDERIGSDTENYRYALVSVFDFDSSSRSISSEPVKKLWIKQNTSASYGGSDKTIFNRPVVTLSSGDLDSDTIDDLSIVSSVGVNVEDKSTLNLFRGSKYNNWIDSDDNVSPWYSIDMKTNGETACAANSGFGSFKSPSGNICTGLVYGGYAEVKDSHNFSNGLYGYLYYDFTDEKIVDSGLSKFSLSRRTNWVSQSYISSNKFYAPMPIACADLEGLNDDGENDDNNDEVLIGASVYDFSLCTNKAAGVTTKGMGSKIGDISLTARHFDDGDGNQEMSNISIDEVRVGSVTTDKDNHSEQFVVAESYRKKNASQEWIDLAAFWLINSNSSTPCSTQEGVDSNTASNGNLYSNPYISLALPDYDNDSVLLKYKGSCITYTNPMIYAVLQAAPYYQDLQDKYDYLNNSATSYGTNTSSSVGEGCDISVEAGLYMESDCQLAFATQYEASVSATASYSYTHNTTKTFSIDYTNTPMGGDDSVVLYSVPVITYFYEMSEPGSDSSVTDADPAMLELTSAYNPTTSMMSVTDYDKIANRTNGLTPIRGNVLTSTPGEPATYIKAISGEEKYKYKDTSKADKTSDGFVTISGSNSSNYITQEIDYDEEDSSTVSIVATECVKVGIGVGFLGNEASVGWFVNASEGVHVDITNTQGTSFSGSTDYLPQEASDYSFQWRLGVYQADMQNSAKDGKIWIVGYDVQKVKQPLSMPGNLRADSVSSESITLKWDKTNLADYYEIYMLDSLGNYNLVDTVAQNLASDTITYKASDLDPSTGYTFAVKAKSSIHGDSLRSNDVTVKTMSEGSFIINTQPSDTHTYAGGTAKFSIDAVYKNANGKVKVLGYQWQYYDTEYEKWVDIDSTNSNSFVVKNVKKSMNNRIYRCRAYYQDASIISAEAVLYVDKSYTNISIGGVNEGQVYNASGTAVTTVQDEKKATTSFSITKDDVSYNLISDGTRYYWYDGENYYKFQADENVIKPAVKDDILTNSSLISEANIGDEIVTDKSYHGIYGYTEDGVNYYKTYDLEEVTPEQDYKLIYSDSSDSSSYGNIINEWKGKEVSDSKGTDIASGTAVFYAASGSSVETWTETDSAGNSKEYSEVVNSIRYLFYENENKTSGNAKAFDLTYDEELGGNAISAYNPVIYEYTYNVNKNKTINIEGDTIKFTANVSEKDTNTTLTDADVTFTVVGDTYSTVVDAKLSSDGETYVAEWTPTMGGSYEVYANYEGSNIHFSSKSSSIKFYAVLDSQSTASNLILNVPINMSYGQSGYIALDKLIAGEDENTQEDITKDAAYSVSVTTFDSKGNSTVKNYTSDEIAAGSVSDFDLNTQTGKFTPNIVGNFSITASYIDSSISKTIAVGKRILTLTAADVTHNQNDEDLTEGMTATVSGLVNSDAKPEAVTDYTLTTSGASITSGESTYTAAGVYDIELELNDTSNNIQALKEKYTIVTVDGTYTLDGNAYTLNADVGNDNGDYTNGALDINYYYNNMHFNVDSGDSIPEYADVMINADPDYGYKISNWVLDGKSLSANETYTISSMEENHDLNVLFDVISSKLSYTVNGTGGAVSAKYVKSDSTQGDEFESGQNVTPLEKFKITAQAADGYVVSGWYKKNSSSTEEILADDDASSLTKSSLDVSGVEEDTTYMVTFEKQEVEKVKINFVDSNGDIFAFNDASLKVNGNAIDIKDGTCTYEGISGDNVTFKIAVPDGLSITSWSEDGKTLSEVSSDKSEYSIYDLSSDHVINIHIRSTNSYSLNYYGTINGNKAPASIGAVSAYKEASSDQSGNITKADRNSIINFKVAPKAGYYVKNVKINGNEVKTDVVTGDAVSYTVSSLKSDTQVVAEFGKKPVISTRLSTGCAISMTGTSDAVSVKLKDGSYVDMDTNMTAVITPDEKHNIKKVNVTGASDDDVTITANADRTYTVKIKNISQDVSISADTVNAYKYTVNATKAAVCVNATGKAVDADNSTLSEKDYIDEGTGIVIKVNPNTGYEIKNIDIDGINDDDMIITTLEDGSSVIEIDSLNNNFTVNAQASLKATPQPTTAAAVTTAAVTTAPALTTAPAVKTDDPDKTSTPKPTETVKPTETPSPSSTTNGSYMVSFDQSFGGVVSASIADKIISSGDTVVSGSKLTFNIVTDEDVVISTATLNGNDVVLTKNDNGTYSYTVDSVKETLNFKVTYKVCDVTGISSVTKNKIKSIVISWNKVSGAAKYKVVYKLNKGKYKTLKTTKRRVEFKKLKSTKLTAKVIAYKKDGSRIGKKVKVKKTFKYENQLKISWNKVNTANEYMVSYKKNADSGWKYVTVSDNTYTITGLTKGKTASFKICALKKYAAGTLSGTYSDESNVTICRHTVVSKIKKATFKKNGKVVTKCKKCKMLFSSKIVYRIAKVYTTAQYYSYTSKNAKTHVYVKDSNGKTISSKYYTLKYDKNPGSVGTHKIKVTFKKYYKGVKTLTYYVVPKAETTVANVTGSNGTVNVSWNQVENADGYVIEYSSSSDYANAQTIKVEGKSSAKQSISAGTGTYYVRVRMYITVDGINYYGIWSQSEKVSV